MDFVRADALSGKSLKLFQRNKEGRRTLKKCPSWLGVRSGVHGGLVNDKFTLVSAFPGLEAGAVAGGRPGSLQPRS